MLEFYFAGWVTGDKYTLLIRVISKTRAGLNLKTQAAQRQEVEWW